MPNGEGTPDPRYKIPDQWKAFLLGLLAGAIHKSFVSADMDIIEIDADAGHFMLQTPEGNFKIKIEVSF